MNNNVLLALLIQSLLVTSLSHAEDGETGTGAISGRVLPEGTSVRIIAKFDGTNHQVAGNIKGEVILQEGGEFTINGLPPGKYDLLFKLLGETDEKYFVSAWTEIYVKAGQTVTGINQRLTPVDAPYQVDEILVTFRNVRDADARAAIEEAGGKVKDEPLKIYADVTYTVNVPDNVSLEEMIERFLFRHGVTYADYSHLTRIGPAVEANNGE